MSRHATSYYWDKFGTLRLHSEAARKRACRDLFESSLWKRWTRSLTETGQICSCTCMCTACFPTPAHCTAFYSSYNKDVCAFWIGIMSTGPLVYVGCRLTTPCRSATFRTSRDAAVSQLRGRVECVTDRVRNQRSGRTVNDVNDCLASAGRKAG